MKRSTNYKGPGLDCEPSALRKYEATGNYISGRKIDGMWAEIHVGNPNEGRPNVLSSRDASTGPILGTNRGDLHKIQCPWPEGTIFATELEAATEWATEVATRKGFRSAHVIDVLQVGDQNVRGLTWEQRRELVNIMFKGKGDLISSRFPVIEPHYSGFTEHYDHACAEGDEGVVLWDRRATYTVQRADGKADDVIRCKKWFTMDYVLFDLGRTPSGVITGEWGLFKNGVLTRTMQATCPAEYLTRENCGSLVVEFKGWKLFKSGALRHASFVRVRKDKPALHCTL